MKKKLAIVGLLGFIFLFGCNVDNDSVEADLPEGFVDVSESFTNSHDVVEIKHKETGCHYLITDGSYSGGIIQMYNEDGMPYCD